MIFRPTPIDPVPRPELSEARVFGDTSGDRVEVAVGHAVTFAFTKLEDGAWTGGQATTLARGYELDERWLTAARGVAVEALRAEALRRGEHVDSDEMPTETVRCPDCERLLCSPLLVREPRRTGVECGPLHVVAFEDGARLLLGPGDAEWDTSPKPVE
jgi:hypothetical protein